jgi:ribonuclease P/MRP protein subunit POP3
LTVGLNSTSRHLEVEAALSKPGSLPSAEAAPKSAEQEPPSKHLAVVFLSKPRDNLVYAHLPLLCYTASAAQKDKAQSTRLVMLDPSCERKIAACMGLPRAGVVGVFDDAPGTASLMDYIRENVGPVEVPWMESALSGKWLGTNVEHRVPGQA